jgi:hypothetical protein
VCLSERHVDMTPNNSLRRTTAGKTLATVTVAILKECGRVLGGLQAPVTVHRFLFSCAVHSYKMSLSVLVAVCCLLNRIHASYFVSFKDGYKLVTLPRIVTPYRDSVDGTRARVTYQKLVTR